jgi:hypothetical protein
MRAIYLRITASLQPSLNFDCSGHEMKFHSRPLAIPKAVLKRSQNVRSEAAENLPLRRKIENDELNRSVRRVGPWKPEVDVVLQALFACITGLVMDPTSSKWHPKNIRALLIRKSQISH